MRTAPVGVWQGRIIFIIVLVIVTFLGYGTYIFSLQVINATEYQQKAQRVARRVIPIPAQRGEIYDRYAEVPLVMNIPSFAVDIIPAEVPDADRNRVYSDLAEILGIQTEDIRKSIPQRYHHLYQPVEVKSGVTFGTITELAERINDFPGVTWHNKPIRKYLEIGPISHILGYVGRITTEELQILYNKGYDINSALGKSGIEKQYDEILRGKDGERYRTVDVRGRSVVDSSSLDVPPVNGKNLVLTIDSRIQALSEKALGERIGSVVVLKPATGEILALVSYPWFDPNQFYTDKAKEVFTKLSLDPSFPFLNRAIQSSYAPASTFKVIMTTAVLEEEVFPLNKRVTCTGELPYGDRIFHCHRKAGHGSLNLAEGLAESCNIFFWTMGSEYLGVERITEYARRFGLGVRSGIDIPGEIKGLVPSPQWKEIQYNVKWVGGDTMNISIGQGDLLVSPIQMANMVAMVVNSGITFVPHILKEVRDPVSGEVLETVEPKVLQTSSIRKETFKTVQDYMRGVVSNGTARVVITTKAVDVAAKTGTGEVGRNQTEQWSSWFASYAPYKTDDPDEQVVVAVNVEGTNEWEWWAPKAANIIFQGIFANQTYEEAVDALNLWYLRN